MIDKKVYVDFKFTGVDSTINFSLTVIDEYSQKDFIIEDKNLDVKPGDTIYFAPKVSVPRVKVKNLTMDYAAKITRDISKADIVVIPENFESILFENQYKYSLDEKKLITFLNEDKRIDTHSLTKLNDVLDNYSNIEFISEWSEYRQLSNLTSRTSYEFDYNSRSNVYLYLPNEDFRHIYEDLKTKTLYKESLILKTINGDDALTIDNKIYEQLGSMLKSSDDENHVIAMEMMSNCNYVDSLFYLELLFKEFSYVMKESYAKNHVNFKSLCKFLGKENSRYMSTDFDDIINSLIKHDKLSEEYLNILVNKYIEDIFYIRSEYFNVHTITLKEDLLESLNINYKVQLTSDFTPVEKQEEIIEELPKEDIEINSETVKWI
jgi:hypothetical protein